MFPDLPILKAYQRINMRPSRLFPTLLALGAIIVTASILCWLWGSRVQSSFTTQLMLFAEALAIICLAAQYISLAIIGCNSISSGLQRDIKSGILEFYRLTTLSVDSILIGYIFGLANHAYLCWIAFAVTGTLSALISQIPLWRYLVVMLAIVLSSFFFSYHICFRSFDQSSPT